MRSVPETLSLSKFNSLYIDAYKDDEMTTTIQISYVC